VAVVGGGNSAVSDALYLSRLAEKVILIHRRDTLKATKIYHDPLMRAENVEFMWNCTVEGAKVGENGRVSGISVRHIGGEVETVAADALFVSIGREPNTGLFEGKLALDHGYIVADESTKTSVRGVFAAGDVRTKALRQVITAASDGAVAATAAEEYLSAQNK
jgi:thioredoxin reductase (NADPH)